MIDKTFTQMLYRLLLTFVSGLAVLLTFDIFYVGVGAETPTWEIFKYYTNLSNYFVFAVSLAVTLDTVKRVKGGEREGFGKKWRTFKFMTTVMITVTFFVYLILLGDPLSADFWRNLGNLSYHVVAPLMFIADFLLFDEHCTLKVTDPLKAVIIPLVYVVYIFILGASIKDFEYPYFFLDVNRLGYGGVVGWVAALVAVFVALGYLFWLYDKLVKTDGKWKLRISGKKPDGAKNAPAADDDRPAAESTL